MSPSTPQSPVKRARVDVAVAAEDGEEEIGIARAVALQRSATHSRLSRMKLCRPAKYNQLRRMRAQSIEWRPRPSPDQTVLKVTNATEGDVVVAVSAADATRPPITGQIPPKCNRKSIQMRRCVSVMCRRRGLSQWPISRRTLHLRTSAQCPMD
jgi:hypothetical protein